VQAFEFTAPNRVVFGTGRIAELETTLAGRAGRVLLVRGLSAGAIARVRDMLSGLGTPFEEFPVHGEPTVDMVRNGVRAARGCGMVVGVGGGSVLDAGKAIAALATNGGDVMDYLEVVGGGKAITEPPLPYIAIPTTAGTGAEVTRNAVVESPEHGLKASMRSPLMVPRLAIVDPELTYDLPPAITAGSGLDALTQLIEPFVSVKANPMTDALCREGIRRAVSLRRAFRDGRDAGAREDMSLASLLGGLALANAGLGAAHGLAGPLGAILHAPHGALCARLLPAVMEANIAALEARGSGTAAIGRYAETAGLLTGDPGASARDGAAWVRSLVDEMGIPRLSALGLRPSRFAEASRKAMASSSCKGNPLPLDESELTAILEEAS